MSSKLDVHQGDITQAFVVPRSSEPLDYGFHFAFFFPHFLAARPAFPIRADILKLEGTDGLERHNELSCYRYIRPA
jgi:hypothetical protein